jgi:hypothetical protein
VSRHLIIAGLLAAGTSLPAVAQEASGELMDAVNRIAETATITMEYGDIDQDGAAEALLVFTDDCNEAGCLFGIVDETAEGALDVVAYQYGESPTLISEARMIAANGVYWTWTGRNLHPWADIYDTLEFYPGTGADRNKILEVKPWFDHMRNYHIQIANVDLIGDETPERFMWLDGPGYKVAQASPFFIYDDEGELLMEGTFLDRPFLFNLQNRKAAAVISHNGSHYKTTILE